MSKKIAPRKSIPSYFYWIIGIILLISAIYYFNQANKLPLDNMPVLTLTSAASTDQVFGNVSGKNILIKYSDFQCPACAYSVPIIKEVVESRSDIKFIYRHFPLRSIHRNADISAQAAEAAGKQGKFWQMHDLLFAQQAEWESLANPKNLFIDYASQLGLDTEKFSKDLESKEIRAKVENDYQSGRKLAIAGTPTFYLNGKKIDMTRIKNADDLKAAITKFP